MRKEIGGHTTDGDHIRVAASADEAIQAVNTNRRTPRRAKTGANRTAGEGRACGDVLEHTALPTKLKRRVQSCCEPQNGVDATGAGQVVGGDQCPDAGSTNSSPKRKRKAKAGDVGQTGLVDQARNAPSPADICQQLMGLQRRRRFLIRSSNRQTNSAGGYVRNILGWRMDLPEKERAAIVKAASKAIKETKGWEPGLPHPSLTQDDAMLIKHTLDRAEPDQEYRAKIESRMKKLARQLPAYSWAEPIKGFGDLALAIVVGEAGDLSNYETKERLWKRLGLAVIDGIRQQRRTNVDEAAAHGYSPKRRAEIYSAVSESLLKWQRSAADPETGEPGKAKGYYGEIYGKRRDHTAVTHPDWTKKHSHNDAMRIMTKELLADLWREWRMANIRVSTSPDVPSAPFLKAAE
jgi:hypothetical protein